MRPGHCASSFLMRTTGWLSFERAWHCGAATLLVAVALASAAPVSHADENGISFWVPGFFGSLAATPQSPGWSLAVINYYTNVSASGNAALSQGNQHWPIQSDAQCQHQRQCQRQGGYRIFCSVLCIRDAVPGRPGIHHAADGLWSKQHRAEWDLIRHDRPAFRSPGPSTSTRLPRASAT